MNLSPLRRYLQQQQEKGVVGVHLSPRAKETLNGLQLRTTQKAPSSETKPKPDLLPVPTGTPMEQLEALRHNITDKDFSDRPDTLRDRLVLFTGDPSAKLMLVGEAPGFQEEKQGLPFVGPAGQKLDQILKAMGFAREQVFLTNICKNRPSMPRQVTNNRPPTADEMAYWFPVLDQEIKIVRPEVIIALGSTAAKALLQTTEAVSKLRGRWHQYRDTPLRVTFHPAYLLHQNEKVSEKRKLWEDMLAAMERLGLPISEKQRGYFK